MRLRRDRITRKSAMEIEKMRVVGRLVGEILRDVRAMVEPGVTTLELDRLAEEKTRAAGGIPAFIGVPGPRGPYRHSLCTSVNDEVVHGIPSGRKLVEGDVIGIDFGIVLDGYVGDSAVTVPVGQIADEVKQLLKATEESLFQAIDRMRPGNRLNDVGGAVEDYVEARGYTVVRDFCGHGIGRKMHEPPQVPNYRSRGGDSNLILREGLVLAIEPMVNLGVSDVLTLSDGWTVATADGKQSAHFEHTIAVTESGPEVLTLVDAENYLTTAAL
ncbi:MAG: type I methionyl aminopeptidase [Blastocatellia bacterium]|nr:type I methionyl aminopeptidase [Blastocatellia bacterium]